MAMVKMHSAFQQKIAFDVVLGYSLSYAFIVTTCQLEFDRIIWRQFFFAALEKHFCFCNCVGIEYGHNGNNAKLTPI